MSVEALSGIKLIQRERETSPREAEQSFYPPNNHHFPQNRDQYAGYIVEELPYLGIDVYRAGLDLARAQFELAQLRLRPINHDPDIPRGDGSTVIIGPGFMGWGRLYQETVKNLKSIGYQAETYPFYYGVHVEPTESMVDDFLSYLALKKEESGAKVNLLLHSKFGHLGYLAHITDPDKFEDSVDQVIDVGSPIPTRVNLVVGTGYLATQYFFGGNDFKLIERVGNGEFFRSRNHVRRTAVRIKNDPIIEGWYPVPLEDQYDAESSHSGALVFRNNIRFFAQRLARPSLAKAA
ncbi:hypothetical protein A3D07_00515 [Candidatus Curtissbacteria bacterium RIFCSPHIGHO2_02_FULL_42_15]|uniref:Alpha/beta hydrolase n=1 Tax=Candidatus Curtissbacteria bacterium RIFCSPHIGHO2_02_FULL_42_15 TaxID=1797716 RepID=A0A1F5GJY5_9BACT|nr:MAG: hypothetical protein A3D07_00515 [Candidatus Curtissbacteria bacterium RIFCSPHIGHO2_02_FULL_42_15]